MPVLQNTAAGIRRGQRVNRFTYGKIRCKPIHTHVFPGRESVYMKRYTWGFPAYKTSAVSGKVQQKTKTDNVGMKRIRREKKKQKFVNNFLFKQLEKKVGNSYN